MMFGRPASKGPTLLKRNGLEDLREEEEEGWILKQKKTLLGKPAQRMGVVGRKPQQDGMRKMEGFEGAEKERDVRRGSLFIPPPDDMTILTIHSGADGTAKLEDSFQLGLGDFVRDEEGSTAIRRPVRRPRKSLAVAPKRIPLGLMQGNVGGGSYDGNGA